MNILIINRLSHKRASFEQIIDITNNLYLICDQVKKNDYENLSGYKSKFFFQDNSGNNGLIEKEALRINEQARIDTLIALSEHDIMRAAYLREYLNIKGQSVKSALAFRDKIIMKETLNAAGIRVPRFKKVYSAIEIIEFSKELGFPLVIKPIDGAGSLDTFVIRNEQELNTFISCNSNLYWDMEEFIDGDMFHIDGFVKNNEIIFSQPSKYINGCLAFKDGKYLGSVVLSDSNRQTMRLNEFNKKILSILPTPETTSFHTEIFITPNDELVFCEIACRTGGGRIHDTIKYQFGFDLFECSIRETCGIKYESGSLNTNDIYGFALIPPQKGKLIKFPDACNFPFIVDYSPSAIINHDYREPSRSIDSFISYIVKGKTELEVQMNLNDVAEWIYQNCEWDLLGS